MNLKQGAKLALSAVRHPVYTAQVLASTRKRATADLPHCARAAADWLLRAQAKSPDGPGYSRTFSLVSGWDCAYIETTGYIIPTLLDARRILGDEKYRASALAAGEWLLGVQANNGAFTDIDHHEPLVFDTGQVLIGLNRLFRETGEQKYLDSARRAAQWLTDVQEDDGSWRRFAYNGRPHTYYSRVAAALMETGQLTANKQYVSAGRRNLEWVLNQERRNGYFSYCEFRPGEDAILHTIVYVLEGFSMAYAITREPRWADAVIRGTTALLAQSNPCGLLYSQYDANWQPTNREFCSTGLAQYAGICFDAFRITREDVFANAGMAVIDYLRSKQVEGGLDVRGGLASSIPAWGYYGCMELYNWNTKFFLDALFKVLAVRS